MSYRTYINGKQVFGNNEYYPEWIDFIKSQGIEVSEDGDYDGYVVDVMGAIETIEKIILRLAKEYEGEERLDRLGDKVVYNEMFDFSSTYRNILQDQKDKYGLPLTDHMMKLKEYGYVFMSVAFIEACGGLIEIDREKSSVFNRLYTYKLKKGKVLPVRAG